MTRKKHPAIKLEAELIPGSGLNVGMLERLFESVGVTLSTVKVICKKPRSKNARR